MNQQVFSKFSQYDLFGYLMVGSIAILIYLFDSSLFFHQPIPAFNLDNIIIWFIATYFTGNVVQGLVSVLSKVPCVKNLVSEDKENFKLEHKNVLAEAKKYFKIKSKSYSYTWNVCYQFVLLKDSTGQIQPFSSYYSLYRGWMIIFIAQSFFMLFMFFTDKTYLNFGLLIISFSLCLIFLVRAKRFWNYLTVKVLQAFTILK